MIRQCAHFTFKRYMTEQCVHCIYKWNTTRCTFKWNTTKQCDAGDLGTKVTEINIEAQTQAMMTQTTKFPHAFDSLARLIFGL